MSLTEPARGARDPRGSALLGHIDGSYDLDAVSPRELVRATRSTRSRCPHLARRSPEPNFRSTSATAGDGGADPVSPPALGDLWQVLFRSRGLGQSLADELWFLAVAARA